MKKMPEYIQNHQNNTCFQLKQRAIPQTKCIKSELVLYAFSVP